MPSEGSRLQGGGVDEEPDKVLHRSGRERVQVAIQKPHVVFQPRARCQPHAVIGVRQEPQTKGRRIHHQVVRPKKGAARHGRRCSMPPMSTRGGGHRLRRRKLPQQAERGRSCVPTQTKILAAAVPQLRRPWLRRFLRCVYIHEVCVFLSCALCIPCCFVSLSALCVYCVSFSALRPSEPTVLQLFPPSRVIEQQFLALLIKFSFL